jgi:RHS repeat-associated protein
MGTWGYTYDVFGNLETQTDARNCVTTIDYDDLNRPIGKTYTGPGACNGTPDVTYTYDSTAGGNEGVGRRTGMSSSSSSSTWIYNILGQVSSQTHNIGANYTISGTYDAFSRPLTQTVPSNGGTETLTYNYNAMGALSSLAGTNTYVSQINYSPSGQVEDQLLGNGLKQQSCYDANTLRMTNLGVFPGTLQTCPTFNPANARLNLSYLYQPNGNISQITDATRSETLTYTYDELDRLDTVSGPYSLNHDYNPIGNITAKGAATYTYNTSHKHAVASLSTGESYAYDANGNMTQRVEGGLTYTQTFDAENRLISVTVSGQTTQFIYDGDGNLVKKVKPDNSKTIYVGGIYEVDKASGGSIQRTVTYYPAAGAMRIDSTLYYILKDHLGSASVVTDATGATVSGTEQRYYPYGESRLTGTMLTDKLFTGQREMAGLGIYHYGARFYSPKLGRFLSPDTIVPGAANPQAYNRYSYVLGNPLKYTDPSGHEPKYGCYDSTNNVCTNANGTSLSPGNGIKKPKKDKNDPQDMQTSEQVENIIKFWEEYREYPYTDAGGTCTIGWGHVLPNDGNGCSGWPNKTYGNGITTQTAQMFFDDDIAKFELLINRTIEVDLTQAQFDALASYTFNTGDQTNNPYFVKNIPELINSGNFEAAAEAIRSGPNTSGDPPIFLDILIDRRQREADIFLYGIYYP